MNIPAVKQLNIAMKWNRIDIGRKIILEEKEWKVSLLNRCVLNLMNFYFESTNHGDNSSRLFEVLSNFPFTTSISIKHGIYELPHELPNGLRL